MPKPNTNRDLIRDGLQELSNASVSEPNCWVTFQANGQEHWLQCTPTRIHMDWPFSSEPAENRILKECFGSALQVHAWAADAYVTLAPAIGDVEALILGIDAAFRDLYDLGPDYALSFVIENA